MCLRSTPDGMLERESQFRKIIGYRDLAKLTLVIEGRPPPSMDQEMQLTPA